MGTVTMWKLLSTRLLKYKIDDNNNNKIIIILLYGVILSIKRIDIRGIGIAEKYNYFMCCTYFITVLHGIVVIELYYIFYSKFYVQRYDMI